MKLLSTAMIVPLQRALCSAAYGVFDARMAWVGGMPYGHLSCIFKTMIPVQ